MAFEAFRGQDQAAPRHRRRVTYALSVGVHAVLITIGVAYSFWHVEELTPPQLRVTFMAGGPPPPPPPPPPAAAGGATKKKVTLKPRTPVVPTKVPDIVQPRETPPPPKKEVPKPDDDDDDDQPAGVKGGVKGGVVGGTVGGVAGGTVGGTVGGTIGGVVGGTGAPGVAAKFLPPNIGALQKMTGSDPGFPASLRKAGAQYLVVAKICVSRTGGVDSVTLMKRADPLLDSNVVNTVKGWRYRPLMANSTAIPFCYFGNFQFTSQ